MSFSEWIILCTGGQPIVSLFYTTYISVDLAYHEIFHAKGGKGGIKIGVKLPVCTKLVTNEIL